MFEDILTEVQATGSVQNPQKRANDVWRSDCYDLRLFTLWGEKLTKGEAFSDWISRRGYRADQCQWKWNRHARPVENGECRELDPEWKKRRLQALMDARACAKERPEVTGVQTALRRASSARCSRWAGRAALTPARRGLSRG